jgi:BTB/POZ domain
LESEKLRINQLQVDIAERIDVNVGGQRFSTTRGTLTKYSSMLEAMFSGRHELTPGPDGTRHWGVVLCFRVAVCFRVGC